MSYYPNFFEYSTKESTLDAIVMWFLECYKRGTEKKDKQMESLGRAFVEQLLFNDYKEELPDDWEIDFFEKQYRSIDVYAVLKSEKENTLYPIIIENKTNTTLHDDQFRRYCKMVAEECKDKNCKIMSFVYIKTGTLFDYEIDWVKSEFCEIQGDMMDKVNVRLQIVSLDNIIAFLKECNEYAGKISLFADYLEYCENLREKQIEYGNWRLKKNLLYEDAQVQFYIDCFGKENVSKNNINLVNSYGMSNTCYTAKVFEEKDDKEAGLFFRFEPRDGDVSFLQVQYYRSSNEFEDRCKSLRKIIEEHFDNLEDDFGCKMDFKSGKNPRKDYKGAEICRFNFNKDLSKEESEAVTKFFKEFIEWCCRDLSIE